MDVKSIIKEEVDNFILNEVETELRELLGEEYAAQDDSSPTLPGFGDRLGSISEEQLNEKTYKVYHGTNQKFSNFNFKNATQGIVWFTDSPESIQKGEHGGQGSKIIMTRYITINKPAGWDEYEKYGLGQLEDMGYDGVILSQGDKTDYFVFSPKSISAKPPAGLNENVELEAYSNPKGYNSEIKTGERYYDNRYGDFYTIEKITPVEGGDADVTLQYDKGKTRTESGNFILYHIDARQHSLAK